MPKFKTLIKDTRLHIFLILLLLWGIALVRDFSPNKLIYPIVSIFLFALLDLVFTYIKAHRLYYPFAGLVSGLLIGLIISPLASLGQIITAVLFGFLAKHTILLSKRQIFNPAAFGITLALLIFGAPISWWGATSGGLSLLSALSVLVLYRILKLEYPFLFLFWYFLYFLLTSGLSKALLLTFDGTFFLFAFIMLPEPITTPAGKRWHYFFPSLVFVLSVLYSRIPSGQFDPFLTALLSGNLIWRVFEKI